MNSKGFVLFEVLVSAAILSAGCLMLVEALQGSLRSTRHAQETYEAALNAGNMSWMLDRSHDPVPCADFVMAGSLRESQYSVQPQPLSAATAADALDALGATVRWMPAGLGTKPTSFTLASYSAHHEPTKS